MFLKYVKISTLWLINKLNPDNTEHLVMFIMKLWEPFEQRKEGGADSEIGKLSIYFEAIEEIKI